MEEQDRRTSYVIVVLIILAFGICLLFPFADDSTTRSDMLHALAEVGGALVGLVGLIGVFGLASIRSSIAAINREKNVLEIERLRTAITVEPKLIADQISSLEYQKREFLKRGRLAASNMAYTLALFIIQIVLAILDLAVPFDSTNHWRLMLGGSFMMLFVGTYFIFLIARYSTYLAE